MNKYLVIVIALSFITLVSSAELDFPNEGTDTKRIFNLERVLEAIRTFLGLEDVLEDSFTGHGGECVQVNAGETGLVFGNCSNATGGGSGDITAVNGDEWITNGSVTGAVNLVFNQTLASETYANLTGDTFTGNVIVQAADSPTIAAVDTTNTVSTIQQSGDTAGVFGTQTTHPLQIITDNVIAAMINTSQAWAFNNTITAQFIVSDDWSNVTINESQILDLNHSGDGGGENNNDGLFVNYTLTTTTGNITNGSLVGYAAADSLCNHEIPGSHMCQAFEVVNSIRLRGVSNFTATFRMSEGAPGFTANANDCVGWRDDDTTFLGSIWVGNNDNGGQGSLVSCSASRAIGCCL